MERALTGPFNRIADTVKAILLRVPLAQVNVQVLEWRGLPPSTTVPAEFPSRLTGACVGVVPIYCRLLETNGALGAPLGGLGLPAWVEVVKSGQGGATIRVTSQDTVSSSTKYVLKWLALGA